MTPTAAQVAKARAVTEWYRTTYYATSDDLGLASTFCDPTKVGHFAVGRAALESGDDDACFRLLVTVAMFQRLRDAFVMRILLSISAGDALELTDSAQLAALMKRSGCPNLRSNERLLAACNLRKDAEGRGTCDFDSSCECHLKRHTELLKRYGHFGKMPTSAALAIREGGGGLKALHDAVWASTKCPEERAVALITELCKVWRISDKLSAMYLSLLCAPNLGLLTPPWSDGVDWTWFVVVDRNVDLFLSMVGYDGPGTYAARRAFVRALAREVDLSAIDPEWPSFHPRLVQQAMYLFMSASNRGGSTKDCSRLDRCATCAEALRQLCPVRNLKA